MAIGAHAGQQIHGTFKEHFSVLQDVLTKAIEQGAATPEEYMGTLLQLLKAVEALRLKNEAALLELERQKAYHTAAVNVCSMMGSLILNVVDARTRERLRILEGIKAIERRQLDEDKARVEELKSAGKKAEAAELEKDIQIREIELKAEDTLALGSEKEVEITKKAIGETQGILGGILGTPQVNPRTRESNAIQEVVSESLKEVPVNEIAVVTQSEKKKRGRPKKIKDV